MNDLRQEFVDLKPADKIASISLVVTILVFIATSISVSLAYLGYSISSAVEERNKHDWSIVQANNLKSFWGDIESVENNIIQQVAVVGSDSGKFMVAAFKVLDEIGSLLAQGKLAKINADNIKLNGEFTRFVSAYASLQSSVEGVAVKYDNSVLIYNPMIEVLDIDGWEEYLNQASKLKQWKSQTMQPYEEAYNLIHSITQSGQIPDNFESTVQELGYKLGYSLTNLSPPSMDGVLALKNKNYPKSTTK
tara:strand:+ start:79 stop:825 length:747 start_codon:yes stop_codon:yes gene_type:complete